MQEYTIGQKRSNEKTIVSLTTVSILPTEQSCPNYHFLNSCILEILLKYGYHL